MERALYLCTKRKKDKNLIVYIGLACLGESAADGGGAVGEKGLREHQECPGFAFFPSLLC